ncbi:WD40 repeat-like protein [Myriangium duriaei CBS 260.36]|uniref:WD40 repeat-like protein n=1 Tax=Myriangium duriaei CBS 260.36 TaxID=1168546 RepID=A0A9P4IWL1_9PEZI|nr:WD40 repeat-like protein [Myriangium duriaei CBS 260.36]
MNLADPEGSDQPATAKPIRQVARECRGLFVDWETSLDDDPDSNDTNFAAEYHAKFEAWAAVLGVFGGDVSSLDYRLRKHPSVQEAVLRLLNILRNDLFLASTNTAYYADQAPAWMQRDEDTANPWASGIKDGIQRLNRLGIWIRSSSKSNATVRARTFAVSLNLDLRAFEHLANLALECLYPNCAESLRQQLAESMTDRYAKLQYEYHRVEARNAEKLAMPKIETPRPMPVVQTEAQEVEPRKEDVMKLPVGQRRLRFEIPASSLVTDLRRKPMDLRSQSFQQRSHAPTESAVDTGRAEPPIPKFEENKAFAKCEWCFGILDRTMFRETSGRFKWSKKGRQHYFNDLRPYVCISDCCSESFPFQDEWLDHMTTAHSVDWLHTVHSAPVWICELEHDHDTQYMFSTQDELHNHTLLHHSHTEHTSQQDVLLMTYGLDSSVGLSSVATAPRLRPSTACPLCLYSLVDSADKTKTPLEKHIGSHMEALMLLTLRLMSTLPENLGDEGDARSVFSGQSERDASEVHQQLSVSDFGSDEEYNDISTISIGSPVPSVSGGDDWGAINIPIPIDLNAEDTKAIDHMRQKRAEQVQAESGVDSTTRAELAKLSITSGAIIDPSTSADRVEFVQGTRTSLLDRIVSWTSDSSAKKILWLSGPPGSGKTTIAYKIVNLLYGQGSLCANFFFNRGQSDLARANRFFPTLAHQLALSIPGLAQSVAKALEDDPFICERGLGIQFDKLLFLPLAETELAHEGQHPRRIVLIDALDECHPPEDVRTIIESLAELDVYGLHCLIFSRPESTIRQALSGIDDNMYMHIQMGAIKPEDTRNDIRIYFEHEFDTMRRVDPALPSNWPGSEAIESLSDIADLSFFSASAICRWIARPNSQGLPPWAEEMQHRLGVILEERQASRLTGLSDLYEALLREVHSDPVSTGWGLNLNGFRRIVGPLICVAEPLSINALSKLLDIQSDRIEKVLRPLSFAMRLPDTRNAPVRLLHASFREFLLDGENGRDFRIDETTTHAVLRDRCLRMFDSRAGSGLTKNLCKVPSPGTQRSEISAESISKYIPEHVAYACRHWVYHAIQNGTPLERIHGLYEAIRKHFLHWLEALSWLGQLTRVFDHIYQLQELVDYELDKDRLGMTLFDDAQRFLQRNWPIIDLAPMQVYYSALCFAPQKSTIRESHSEDLNEFSLLPTVPLIWTPEILSFAEHEKSVTTVDYSPDGTMVASGSYDMTIKLWTPQSGKDIHTIMVNSPINAVAFSPDGQTLASATEDHAVRLWDVETGGLLHTFFLHEDAVEDLAFSPDGHWIVSGSEDHTVRVIGIPSGDQRHVLRGHEDSVSSVAVSSDGNTIASGSSDHTVRLWDARTGLLLTTFEGHRDRVYSVAFSHDEKTIASGSLDKTVCLWDAETGAHSFTLKGHDAGVEAVTFSPDSKMLASGSADDTVRLWDPVTGEEVRKFEGAGGVHALVFSSSGRILASASQDYTVRLWDVQSAEDAQPVQRHNAEVVTVACAPQGDIVASGSKNGTVIIWSTETGQELNRIQVQDDDDEFVALEDIDFTPEKPYIVTRSLDTSLGLPTTKYWHSRTGNPIELHHDADLLQTTHEYGSKPRIASQHYSLPGAALGVNGQWIQYKHEDLLWLPRKYRATASAAYGDTLVLGHASGNVSLFRYKKAIEPQMLDPPELGRRELEISETESVVTDSPAVSVSEVEDRSGRAESPTISQLRREISLRVEKVEELTVAARSSGLWSPLEKLDREREALYDAERRLKELKTAQGTRNEQDKLNEQHRPDPPESVLSESHQPRSELQRASRALTDDERRAFDLYEMHAQNCPTCSDAAAKRTCLDIIDVAFSVLKYAYYKEGKIYPNDGSEQVWIELGDAYGYTIQFLKSPRRDGMPTVEPATETSQDTSLRKVEGSPALQQERIDHLQHLEAEAMRDAKSVTLQGTEEGQQSEQIGPDAEDDAAKLFQLPSGQHRSSNEIDDETYRRWGREVLSLGGPIPAPELTYAQVHKSDISVDVLKDRGIRWKHHEESPDFIVSPDGLSQGTYDELHEETLQKGSIEKPLGQYLPFTAPRLRRAETLPRSREDSSGTKGPGSTRIHLSKLSIDVLNKYHLGWKYDPEDPNYIIIRRELERDFLEELIETSKQYWTDSEETRTEMVQALPAQESSPSPSTDKLDPETTREYIHDGPDSPDRASHRTTRYSAMPDPLDLADEAVATLPKRVEAQEEAKSRDALIEQHIPVHIDEQTVSEREKPRSSSLADKPIPAAARWTKVSRLIVNPEALEQMGEPYEEREDYVVILRVLTRDEIDKLATKTREIREERLADGLAESQIDLANLAVKLQKTRENDSTALDSQRGRPQEPVFQSVPRPHRDAYKSQLELPSRKPMFFPRAHRRELSPTVLNKHHIGWRYDPVDPNYINIQKEMDQDYFEKLCEETGEHRERTTISRNSRTPAQKALQQQSPDLTRSRSWSPRSRQSRRHISSRGPSPDRALLQEPVMQNETRPESVARDTKNDPHQDRDDKDASDDVLSELSTLRSVEPYKNSDSGLGSSLATSLPFSRSKKSYRGPQHSSRTPSPLGGEDGVSPISVTTPPGWSNTLGLKDLGSQFQSGGHESASTDPQELKEEQKGQRFFCTDYPPCNLSFARSEHLARHIRKHTGERPFQCHCGRRFSRLDDLRQHAQAVHVNEEISGDPQKVQATVDPLDILPELSGLEELTDGGSTLDEDHECPYCSKWFRSHDNLKSHLSEHSADRPYSCTVCSANFRRLHDLRRHEKLHVGDDSIERRAIDPPPDEAATKESFLRTRDDDVSRSARSLARTPTTAARSSGQKGDSLGRGQDNLRPSSSATAASPSNSNDEDLMLFEREIRKLQRERDMLPGPSRKGEANTNEDRYRPGNRAQSRSRSPRPRQPRRHTRGTSSNQDDTIRPHPAGEIPAPPGVRQIIPEEGPDSVNVNDDDVIRRERRDRDTESDAEHSPPPYYTRRRELLLGAK